MVQGTRLPCGWLEGRVISELVFWRYHGVGVDGAGCVTLRRAPAASPPYGRHSTSGWELTLSARTGWLVMETPAAVLLLYWYLVGSHSGSVVAVTLLCMWESHYVHRAFVYPFSLSPRARAIPVAVVVFGLRIQRGEYVRQRAVPVPPRARLPARLVAGRAFCLWSPLVRSCWVLNRYADDGASTRT